MAVRNVIIDQFEKVAQEHNRKLAPLADGLPLLDSGLDSLCMAIVVARLDDELGCDPFGNGQEACLPVTLRDFISLYENAVR